jgi:uncharacterized protein GlcG (DUF336 family)
VSQITLDKANAVIAAAFAKGRELSLRPLSIAVVDAGGHVIASQRQDGTSFGRLQIAHGKAAGALALGVSSRQVGVLAEERPWFVGALVASAPHPMIPAAGAVIVVDTAGHPVGAVGVTGDTSDNDEICAIAGVEAAGLTLV